MRKVNVGSNFAEKDQAIFRQSLERSLKNDLDYPKVCARQQNRVLSSLVHAEAEQLEVLRTRLTFYLKTLHPLQLSALNFQILDDFVEGFGTYIEDKNR